MANPIIVIKDAGTGETPPCPGALFKRGDVVRVRKRRSVRHFPREAIVAAVVPPGFPAEYALADLLGEPRPLMITKSGSLIAYILVREGDPKPYLCAELYLRPSGKEPVEIGSIRRATDAPPAEG